MIFDELKRCNSVSFKLRSLNEKVSHSSHIQFKMFLAYHCDTQKQSSGEFVKCIGKQLFRSPFLNTVASAGRLKKRLQKCFLRTLPEDYSKFFFFTSSLTVLYMHSRNNCNFSRKVYFSNDSALFAVNVWYLYHGAKAS